MAEDWRVEPTRGTADTQYRPKFSQPVIADGTLIAANRLVFGTNVEAPDKQFVRAFDANTGDQTWQYTIGSESNPAARDLPTMPAVWGDVVLIGHDETVRAVDLVEGTDVWRRSLDTQIHAVVPTDARIHVRAHRAIIALQDGGTPLWSTPFQVYPPQLAVGHRNLYVSANRRIHALNPESGKKQWTVKLPAVDSGYGVSRLVAVQGGVIVMQNSGDVYGIDDQGNRLWNSEGQYKALVTDGTRVYVGSDGVLRALAVPTGERLWHRSCSDVSNCDTGSEFRPSLLTNGILAVSLSEETLLGVSPADGTTQWTKTDLPRLRSFALDSNALYGVGDTHISRIAGK